MPNSIEEQLRALSQSLEGSYSELNGGPAATPMTPPERGDITDAAVILELAATAYPRELNQEIELQRQAQGYAPLSRSQVADIASRVAMRHAPELYRERATQEGHVVDARGLAPAYLQELVRRGVGDAEIAEAAERLFPGVDRRTALARWAEKAKKMDGSDLRATAIVRSLSLML